MKCIVLVFCLAAAFVPASQSDNGLEGPVGRTSATTSATVEGKDVKWWAKRAKQARRDANARAATSRRLRLAMDNDPGIQECIRLATIAYPAFTERRAWQIINHESGGNRFAKNSRSSASGLYQFLVSTWMSTPYGRAGMSIWSSCASSLAAGWMHQNGRGGEWAIG